MHRSVSSSQKASVCEVADPSERSQVEGKRGRRTTNLERNERDGNITNGSGTEYLFGRGPNDELPYHIDIGITLC